jgi:hypothetical protein
MSCELARADVHKIFRLSLNLTIEEGTKLYRKVA